MLEKNADPTKQSNTGKTAADLAQDLMSKQNNAFKQASYSLAIAVLDEHNRRTNGSVEPAKTP